MNYWADEGVTWFKAYTDISREVLRAAIVAAHKRGLKFTGHLCSVSFREAVALGIDNLEHGLFTNSDFVPNRTPDHCSPEMRTSILKVSMDGPEVQQTIREMVSQQGGDVVDAGRLRAVVSRSSAARGSRARSACRRRRVRNICRHERKCPTARRNRRCRSCSAGRRRSSARSSRPAACSGAGVDPTGVGGALPGFGDQRNFELLIEAGLHARGSHPDHDLQRRAGSSASTRSWDRSPPARSPISS